MKTTVNIIELKNFLHVLFQYSKAINNPYMIDATQQFEAHLLGEESEEYCSGLLAYSDSQGNRVNFISQKK